jgi:hypothetical protein
MGLEGTQKGPYWIEAAIGIGVHKGIESLLLGSTVDEAVREAQKEWEQSTSSLDLGTNPLLSSQVREGGFLVEAFVMGWGMHRLPLFLSTYEVLTVEREIKVPLSSNVILYARADVVVRERSNGAIWVFNHKTCKEWDQRDWFYDIQMITEGVAVQDDVREDVAGIVVEGFYKGERRNGFFTTPLLYAYRSKAGVLKAGYTAGWEKLFIPDVMSISEWLANPAFLAVIDVPFRRSSPITISEAMVEKWLKTLVRRETEIENILSPDVPEEDRLDFFTQRITKKTCPWCPFEDICFERTTVEEMLKDGKLSERKERRTRGAVDSGVGLS